MKKYNFVNLRSINKDLPDKNILDNIKIGDKLSFYIETPKKDCFEKVEVIVLRVENEDLTGKIDSLLYFGNSHGLFLDSIIDFKKENIYSIES